MIFAECECNKEGSANGKVCHQTSGVCTCKPGWFGKKCQGKMKLNVASKKTVFQHLFINNDHTSNISD